MNWYKKAQYEQNKIKYYLEDNAVYFLSRNVKPDEGPWRVSLLPIYGELMEKRHGHEDFSTYEEALERFDSLHGIESGPDLDMEQVADLEEKQLTNNYQSDIMPV